MTLPYRDFYYPLNVFMHILSGEEGRVDHLHYGLFEKEGEAIGTAQLRSTELLLSRLPPPPARLLEVGVGLGTTLRRLTDLGYDVEGITPDDKQISMVRARHGDAVRAHCAPFETFQPERTYDTIFFQESSQYIDSTALFARARELASHVVVIDEFAMESLDTPGALHRYDAFLAAAEANGFRKIDDVDLSAKAAPTIAYFLERLDRYRDALIRDLGLTGQQVDELVDSGLRYSDFYKRGVYSYRLIELRR